MTATVGTVTIRKLLAVYLPDSRVPGQMNRFAHIGAGSAIILPTGNLPHPFWFDGQIVKFTPVLTVYRDGDTSLSYVKSDELRSATS